MAPKKTTVQFGKPVDDIPDHRAPSNTGNGAQHWQMVAEHTKATPGVWHPITIGHLSVNRHKQVVSSINGSHKADCKTRIYAFRDGGYQAAFREGQLYVKYVPPAAVTSIRGGKTTPIRRRKTA